MHGVKLALVFSFAALIVSCEIKSRPINYGEDGCDYCRMTIIEEHYGAELLTTKGKAYVFDSIECLAAFIIKREVVMDEIHTLYCTDVETSGELFPVNELVFVYAKKLRSPMGLNLSAYRNKSTAENVAELYFGELLEWDELIGYVNDSWF
jgi:copper chaperone NosL